MTASGVGVSLREAAGVAKLIKLLLVEDFELINPDVARPKRDRVTVYLAKHGPFAAPFPAPAITVEWLLEQGEYDDFVVVTLFHRVVEYIPILKPMLKRYWGHSTDKLSSLSGLTEMMRERAFHMVGTAPEATSCFGEYSQSVGPFAKVGLIVAALESDADIVVAAQKGVEVFSVPLRLPWGLSVPVRGRPTGFIAPYWRPGLRARVKIKFGRYQPLVGFEDRMKMSASERRRSNDIEIERIRQLMIELYDSIPD
jgi:hypothetical protein